MRHLPEPGKGRESQGRGFSHGNGETRRVVAGDDLGLSEVGPVLRTGELFKVLSSSLS